MPTGDKACSAAHGLAGSSAAEGGEPMKTWSRRSWLEAVGLGWLGAGMAGPSAAMGESARPVGDGSLALRDFRPKSMLHVPQTRVERPRFPVIDIHTHL